MATSVRSQARNYPDHCAAPTESTSNPIQGSSLQVTSRVGLCPYRGTCVCCRCVPGSDRDHTVTLQMESAYAGTTLCHGLVGSHSHSSRRLSLLFFGGR